MSRSLEAENARLREAVKLAEAAIARVVNCYVNKGLGRPLEKAVIALAALRKVAP